jgi:hypothetical protein
MRLIIFIKLIIVVLIFTVLIWPNKMENFKDLGKNLVMITSVIHTAKEDLSYAKRSVYTHAERLEQTYKSIRTAKEKVPNAVVVLVEGSEITEEETTAILAAGVDYIHRVDKSKRRIIDSPHKSIAEITLMLDFFKSDYMQTRTTTFVTLSKLSGRYFLNDKFDFSKFDIDQSVFLCTGVSYCETRYFRINMKYFDEFVRILEGALTDPEILSEKKGVESYAFPTRFSPPHKLYMRDEGAYIGVEGNIAVSGQHIEEFRVS